MEKFYNDETKIFDMPDKEVEIHPKGLGCLMYERMKTYSDNVFQIDAETGTTDKYSSFLQRCNRAALKMTSMGLKPGDVISICSYNHLENTVPFVAGIFIGVKVASLDPSLSLEDTKHLMNLVKPKLVFTSVGSEELIENAANAMSLDSKVVSFGEGGGYMRYSEFLEEQPGEDDFEPRAADNVDETILIMFSSGTTGLPKGICLSHQFMIFHCTTRISVIAIGFASLFWMSSNFITVSAIINGTAKVCCPKFDPKLTWKYIEECKITNVIMAPCDAIKLCEYFPENSAELPLKLVGVGGGFMPWSKLVELRKRLPKALVISGYGLTEILGCFNALDPTGYVKENCVGTPLPGRSYKLVDPETEEVLGFNQSGELRVKTKWCTNGYYNQDSTSIWDSEGFLKTGDIFYYDENFCFYFVDRLKEMFKYRSWHIVPAKLEAILTTHPDVSLNVVVGLPHVEDDSHAIAIVVPKENAEATPEDIRKFVDDQVDDRHKLRGGVMFVKELPMTPSGKIKRRALVKMIVDNEF